MKLKKNYFIVLIATGLGTGYSSIASGTVGSLLGIFIYIFLVMLKINLSILALLITTLFFAGVYVSTKAEKIFVGKDPGQIVIDEIVGAMIYLYIIPLSWKCVIFGFIIYRILDIIKPPPGAYLEKLHGGWGIMLDDVIAGLYAGIVIKVLVLIKGFF